MIKQMKKRTKTLRHRKSRSRKLKKQRGGFVPSIYHGVSNAVVLAPLALKQAYRLWNSRKTRKARKKTFILDSILD